MITTTHTKNEAVKTDASCEENWEKNFRVDQTESALSAEAAIVCVLFQTPRHFMGTKAFISRPIIRGRDNL